jgi:hypothetical protein
MKLSMVERMKKQDKKVPVTFRAVYQRVNRALAKEGEGLRANRGARNRDTGEFYIVGFNRNAVLATHVDVEALARDLDVLKPWETVVSDA